MRARHNREGVCSVAVLAIVDIADALKGSFHVSMYGCTLVSCCSRNRGARCPGCTHGKNHRRKAERKVANDCRACDEQRTTRVRIALDLDKRRAY